MSQDALNIARLLLSNKQENKELAVLLMDSIEIEPYDVWSAYTNEMIVMAEPFCKKTRDWFRGNLFGYDFNIWLRTKYYTGKGTELLFFEWQKNGVTIEQCFYEGNTREWRGIAHSIHASLNTAYQQRETA